MIVDYEYQGYDMEKCGRKIIPNSARPARTTYLWYIKHRPHMQELSRKAGKAICCAAHPDGRCTKGWEEGWDGKVAEPEPQRTVAWVSAEDLAYYQSFLAKELLWLPAGRH